jgi:hypothetical protein
MAQVTGHVGAAVLTAMWLALAGCEIKGGPGLASDGAAESGDHWRIRPVAMRVYPSSGFTEYGGRHVLEARIELLDEMGDTVKGVGHFRFELFAGEGPGQSLVGRLVENWDVAMLSLEQNRAHYDPITRTYRFMLGMTRPPPKDEPMQLAATLTPPGGRRIDARAMLPLAGQ